MVDPSPLDREIAALFKATEAPGFRYAFKERQVLSEPTPGAQGEEHARQRACQETTGPLGIPRQAGARGRDILSCRNGSLGVRGNIQRRIA